MPTTYAHLYFGRRALTLLPDAVAKAVEKNRQLYDIGLHGPDILFYYQPLKSNPIGRRGNEMHDRPAREFFYPARKVYKSMQDREAALAYLAGFLCHYALDSACHGYIEKKIRMSKLTHGEIESEFDRYLIRKDGRNISNTDLTAHIVPSSENAFVIASFFSGITEKQIKRTLSSMKFCCNMLSGKGWRRPVLDTAFKFTGNYAKLHKMIMAKDPLPESEDSNLRLDKLLEKGLCRYAELIGPYETFLQGGSFPDGLDQTFGPSDDWREIPVLSVEEEKNYEV